MIQAPVHRRIRTLASVVTLLILSLVSVSAEDRFRRGDSNGDGTVDLSDGIRLLLSLFDQVGMPSCADAADANDSGALDLADAVFTFEFLFNGGAVPPAPGVTQCGDDPTPDDLGCEEFLQSPGRSAPTGDGWNTRAAWCSTCRPAR